MTTLRQKLISAGTHFGGNRYNYNYAFDLRAFFHSEDSSILSEVAHLLWEKVKRDPPQVLYGKGIGAYPLLIAIKQRAFADNVNMSILFARDSRKTRGVFRKTIEGPSPASVNGKKALFVDDLYNTGATYRQCLESLRVDGYDLNHIGVATVVDFWVNSRVLHATGVPFYYLFKRHDLGITRHDAGLPSPLAKVMWRIDKHHEGRSYMPLKSMPVIHDGLLYLGNDDTSQTCYDLSTGDTVWRVVSKNPVIKGTVSVMQLHAGLAYWSSYDGTIRCVDARTGAHKWVTKVDLNLHSSPCLDPPRNRMFIGTELDKQQVMYGRGDIVALTMDTGRTLWRTQTRGMVPGTCSYSPPTNLVVCGSNDFHIYVMDGDTGEVRLKVPTRGEFKGKPAVTDCGHYAIVCTNYGYTYCINLHELSIVWERRIALEATHCYPVICGDSVVCTTLANTVMSMNIRTGVVDWVTQLRDSVGWGVTKATNCLIATTISGYVVLLDIATGAKLASDRLTSVGDFKGASCYQPSAYDGEHLVVATDDRGIVCFNLDTEELLHDRL